MWALVDACLEYPGAAHALVDILETFHPGSLSVDALRELVHELLPDPWLDQAGRRDLFRELLPVADALLDIPRLRTERGRDQVVGALPLDIAGAIPRSGEARADLIAILQTCLDYPGGLQRLLQVIHGFVGESMAVQRLEQTIARLLAGRPPRDAG